MLLLCAFFVLHFLQVHAHHPLGAGNPAPARAWFGWADQGAYFVAARAWAGGDLAAAHHLYPAGYALLGAPFVSLMPGDPFLVPDIGCWIASLWLFAALAEHLGRGMIGTRLAGGLVFFLVTVAGSRAFYVWEIPWTSTPAATLTFAALLATIRAGGRLRCTALAAALAGAIVLFRPTDAIVVISSVGAMLAWPVLRREQPFAVLLAAGAGFCAGPALLLATHLLTHGWTLGYYFAMSRQIGFEWRLLPLRWVTMVLSPRPLFPSGAGLASLFPHMLPGIAGILACMMSPQERLRHVWIGCTAIAFLCLYLCYRDLHPQGLIEFLNYHYFKWTLPIFALYALNLLHVLAERRWRAGAAAIAVVALLSCWRVETASDASATPARIASDGRTMQLPDGLTRIDQAVLVPAPDDFLAIYFGQHIMVGGDGRGFTAGPDFKLFPVPHGFMIAPLRPMPAPLSMRLASTLRLNPASVPVAIRQRLVFGLPCAVLRRRAICQYRDRLAPGRHAG